MHAEAVRRALALPIVPELSVDTLAATGLGRNSLTAIRKILDSYHHTNALALVVLSALLERYNPRLTGVVQPSETAPSPPPTELPALPSMATLQPEVRRLIEKLNAFGEDTDASLIASMYRHLAHWPPYLAIVQTMLAPLAANGSLNELTRSAQTLGRAHGQVLAHQLAPDPPPDSIEDALASCRLFVEHPIARMRESARLSVVQHLNRDMCTFLLVQLKIALFIPLLANSYTASLKVINLHSRFGFSRASTVRLLAAKTDGSRYFYCRR